MADPQDKPRVSQPDSNADVRDLFMRDILNLYQEGFRKLSETQRQPGGTSFGASLKNGTSKGDGDDDLFFLGIDGFKSKTAGAEHDRAPKFHLPGASESGSRVFGEYRSPFRNDNVSYADLGLRAKGESSKNTGDGGIVKPAEPKQQIAAISSGDGAKEEKKDAEPVSQDKAETPEKKTEVAPPPKLAPVKSADGTSLFQSTESGGWQIKDKFGEIRTEHPNLPGQKITSVESQSDGSVKVTVADGRILRERPDGGRIIYPDDAAFNANHPVEIVGRSKDIVWDGDKVKSFHSVTTKGTFYQVADDVWSSDPAARTGWSGHIEYDGVNGTWKRTTLEAGAEKGVRDHSRANGISEQFRPDGSYKMVVPYPDGTRASFTFKQGFSAPADTLKQPDELKIVDPQGAETVWTRVGPDEYKSSSGASWKVDIELKTDGTYSYKEAGGDSASRTKAGHYEKNSPADNKFVEKENGQYTRVKLGNDELQVEYGADGKPVEYRHVNKNLKVTRSVDATWTDAPIDGSKAYAPLPKFERDMYSHSELDPFQKIRMSDTIAQFRALSKFTDAQKDKVFSEADRLLNGRKDSAMTAREKANYADQLFWHLVNDKRNEQGSFGTCSVTALRGISIKEQPWVLAKVAADLANDGQLLTRDGSVIKPKLDSMRVRPGSPEESFPPSAPNRSALSKLWDVGTVNVSVQRDSKDPFGFTVPKGSMSYEEVAPTGRSDCGSRIVKRDGNGTEYVLYSTSKNGSTAPYDSPRVGYPSRIADIWHQLTGEKLTDRFLVHDNRWVDDKTVFSSLVGSKQKSEQEVEAVLKSNDKAKVTQANTGILEQRYRQQVAINEGKDPNAVPRPAGGEHLFLVTAYDAATKTVTIDNSWSTGYDMPNKQEATAAGRDPQKTIFISLKDLYEAMKTQTAGDSSTLSWMQR